MSRKNRIKHHFSKQKITKNADFLKIYVFNNINFYFLIQEIFNPSYLLVYAGISGRAL